ncbi:hypothetical protein Y1Q_0021255 [Alligator mississippiensis]|uniref:Uncharacterized protein n=1 Tax=Alligator mississippiensis TaxID=8496 RepID=A0A151MS33_ALLMI|nr:hypothetical protein Y1Q_0021255 [Alligator mississippiensis]
MRIFYFEWQAHMCLNSHLDGLNQHRLPDFFSLLRRVIWWFCDGLFVHSLPRGNKVDKITSQEKGFTKINEEIKSDF